MWVCPGRVEADELLSDVLMLRQLGRPRLLAVATPETVRLSGEGIRR